VDDLGKPAPGAVVSFQLPGTGPSGVFTNGLRTDIVVTDSEGVARVSGIRWNGEAGTATLRLSASKGGERAGTLLDLVVSEPASIAIRSQTESAPRYSGGGRSHKKTILLILAAGGGVAAIALARSSQGSSSNAAIAPGSIVSGGTVTLSVGPPSLTVGKP
jgi:hypothetical protein